MYQGYRFTLDIKRGQFIVGNEKMRGIYIGENNMNRRKGVRSAFELQYSLWLKWS